MGPHVVIATVVTYVSRYHLFYSSVPVLITMATIAMNIVSKYYIEYVITVWF